MKSRSKAASKQAKENTVSSDKENESSPESSVRQKASSEADSGLSDTNGHGEVSVPSPDDAALPSPSLCPAVNVDPKDLNDAKKCLHTKTVTAGGQKSSKPSSESLADGQQKEVLDVKEKKVSSAKKTKNGDRAMKNKVLTDYFQVRRSSRKLFSVTEKQKFIEEAIKSGMEEGFEVKEFADKGRGVVAKKEIKCGDFVLEYSGELLSFNEAKKRELFYGNQEGIGCYMYYFKYKDKKFCVDATKENGRLGRLVNHSKKGNLKTQAFLISDRPHLIFTAKRDIPLGEELLYDYGDRSKASLKFYPWLAT